MAEVTSPGVARRITIDLAGVDEDAMMEALNEVGRLLKGGFLSGVGRNEASSFSFDSIQLHQNEAQLL